MYIRLYTYVCSRDYIHHHPFVNTCILYIALLHSTIFLHRSLLLSIPFGDVLDRVYWSIQAENGLQHPPRPDPVSHVWPYCSFHPGTAGHIISPSVSLFFWDFWGSCPISHMACWWNPILWLIAWPSLRLQFCLNVHFGSLEILMFCWPHLHSSFFVVPRIQKVSISKRPCFITKMFNWHFVCGLIRQSIWHVACSWHAIWNIFWRSMTLYPTYFLCDKSSAILSDILSDIFWHFTWHSMLHIFRHSVLQIFCVRVRRASESLQRSKLT